MTYLKKEEIFFDRDGEGNVIPIEVTLDTLPNKPLVKVTPLRYFSETNGKWRPKKYYWKRFTKFSEEVKDERRDSFYYFLHERGYTFFTVPKLLLCEINLLIREFNRQEKKKERDYKKVQQKAKSRRR